MDHTAEWENTFVLVPRSNGQVGVCLDPVRLHLALIQPVHRGSTLNDIFPGATNVKYLSLIDASSRYQNLSLNEQ